MVDVFVFEESSREEDICLRLYKSYDENGNLVKDMTYDSNCNWDKNLVNLREIYICEYDSNGNLLKEQKKDYRVGEGKSSIELIHKYDNEGLKKGTNLIYDLRGMTVNIITNFVRDENRKIIEIIENQKTPYNKIKYSEKFEYDNYNNILKIFFFKNDKPKYLIERQLEYY